MRILLSAMIMAPLALGACAPAESETTETDTSAATELSAEEVFEVSAVGAVKADGFAVTSAVCEVVSPQEYRRDDNIFGGKLVFHAFRVSGPGMEEEATVLFASNHAAADGAGLVIPVNQAAVALDQGFPRGSDVADPITENTPGAADALACAQSADRPAVLETGNFDVEAWRSEAVHRFGPEKVFDDGSKSDYVKLAYSICKQTNAQRQRMVSRLATRYSGSMQEFIMEEFCPHI